MHKETTKQRIVRLRTIARLKSELFDKQREAIVSESQLVVWQCTRRAGKTTTAMYDFVIDGLQNPGSKYVYICLRKDQAREIVWNIISDICARHIPGAKLSQHWMTVVLPNGARLKLYGADRDDLHKLLYGLKLRRAYIDEAAFFVSDLKGLVKKVLKQTILDENGKIIMMSIVGEQLFGYFHDVVNKKNKAHFGWDVYEWTTFDNPYMCDIVQKELDELAAMDPDALKHPDIRRQYFNEWVSVVGDRVYGQYDPGRVLTGEGRKYDGYESILGIDLGWEHYTGFVVLSYLPTGNEAVARESFRERHLLVDDIARICRAYMESYPGIRIVCDWANRGEFESIRRQYQLPIIPAEKGNKRFYQELVNTAMRDGRLKIDNTNGACDSLVEELTKLVWKQKPGGDVIENLWGTSNDVADAFLYAFRFAYHLAMDDKLKEEREPKSDEDALVDIMMGGQRDGNELPGLPAKFKRKPRPMPGHGEQWK